MKNNWRKAVLLMTQSKPILIQYKGGGYSGCFWEWNYGFISEDKLFSSIHASGYKGCENIKDMRKYLEDTTNTAYIYDLESKESILEFTHESNGVHVVGVGSWLDKNHGITIYAPCTICGDEDAIYDYEGIILEGEDMICHDCHSTNTCGYCGEFYHDQDDVEKFDEEGYCEYCQEQIKIREE
jgi:hypothetical protein